MRGGTPAKAAAVAGGGVGALALAGYAVLFAEATLARRMIGSPFGDIAPDADGWYVPVDPATNSPTPSTATGAGPLTLAIIGDSGAAGLGVETPEQTPGAILARGLAAATGRPVRLACHAVVGAKSADLAAQLDDLDDDPLGQPDIVVICIGGNDITNQVRIPSAVADLAEAVARLRTLDVEVVVATCPDLGTIRPVAQPLRAVARRLSRQLASAQTVAAVSAGATTVSLSDLLGPAFHADPNTLFSSDRFHPSAAGYARMAEAVLPAVCTAAGVPTATPEPSEAVALSSAAALAVDRAGAEVAPATVDGGRLGPRGAWAQIRRWPRIPWKDDANGTDIDVGSTG